MEIQILNHDYLFFIGMKIYQDFFVFKEKAFTIAEKLYNIAITRQNKTQ